MGPLPPPHSPSARRGCWNKRIADESLSWRRLVRGTVTGEPVAAREIVAMDAPSRMVARRGATSCRTQLRGEGGISAQQRAATPQRAATLQRAATPPRGAARIDPAARSNPSSAQQPQQRTATQARSNHSSAQQTQQRAATPLAARSDPAARSKPSSAQQTRSAQ